MNFNAFTAYMAAIEAVDVKKETLLFPKTLIALQI